MGSEPVPASLNQYKFTSFLAILLFCPVLDAAKPNAVDKILTRIQERFESTPNYKAYATGNPGYSKDLEVFRANPASAKVMMLMQADALVQALVEGEIKNQHQTGFSGGGHYGPELRLELEEEMAGLSFKQLGLTKAQLLELLPKYGMVEFVDFAKDPISLDMDIRTSEELDTYGEIEIYFKNSVRKRTTMMPQDSGNFALLNHRGDEVTIVDGIDKQLQSMRQDRMILITRQMDEGHFFEAEVWGRLRTADIDYIVMPKDLWYDEPTLMNIADLHKLLRASGIPVYRTKYELSETEKQMEQLRVRFRGRKLYPEDLKKRKSFPKSSLCNEWLAYFGS